MKKIRYTPEFTRPDGYPFTIQNPDPAVRAAAIAVAVAAGRETAAVPMVAVDFANAIIWFMNGIPFEMEQKGTTREGAPVMMPLRKPTAEDFGNNYAVIKAFRDAEPPERDFVELSDSVYNWLMDMVRLDGPIAFHNTQPEVAKRLNDVITEDLGS